MCCRTCFSQLFASSFDELLRICGVHGIRRYDGRNERQARPSRCDSMVVAVWTGNLAPNKRGSEKGCPINTPRGIYIVGQEENLEAENVTRTVAGLAGARLEHGGSYISLAWQSLTSLLLGGPNSLVRPYLSALTHQLVGILLPNAQFGPHWLHHLHSPPSTSRRTAGWSYTLPYLRNDSSAVAFGIEASFIALYPLGFSSFLDTLRTYI